MSVYNNSNLITTLQRGGLAVIPTDTVYGIVTSALNHHAVERLYAVRQRPLDQPSIILLDSVARLADFDVVVTEPQRAAIADLWPGPHTIILEGRPDRFAFLNPNGRNLAFRVPAVSDLRTLLAATGPLLAPSANLPGQPPAISVEMARSYFGDAVDIYIDGGAVNANPSRIVEVRTDGTVCVIRP